MTAHQIGHFHALLRQPSACSLTCVHSHPGLLVQAQVEPRIATFRTVGPPIIFPYRIKPAPSRISVPAEQPVEAACSFKLQAVKFLERPTARAPSVTQRPP